MSAMSAVQGVRESRVRLIEGIRVRRHKDTLVHAWGQEISELAFGAIAYYHVRDAQLERARTRAKEKHKGPHKGPHRH